MNFVNKFNARSSINSPFQSQVTEFNYDRGHCLRYVMTGSVVPNCGTVTPPVKGLELPPNIELDTNFLDITRGYLQNVL